MASKNKNNNSSDMDDFTNCGGYKDAKERNMHNAKAIENNRIAIERIDKSVARDVGEIKGTISGMASSLESISKTIADYIKKADEVFVSKGEFKSVLAESKSSKRLWGVVGGCVGGFIMVILILILGSALPIN